jgi:hypothetical protein
VATSRWNICGGEVYLLEPMEHSTTVNGGTTCDKVSVLCSVKVRTVPMSPTTESNSHDKMQMEAFITGNFGRMRSMERARYA